MTKNYYSKSKPLKKIQKNLKTIIHNRKLYKNLNFLYKQPYQKKLYRYKNFFIFSKNYIFPYNYNYKFKYKKNLNTKQKFNFFYGILLDKYIKKIIKKIKIKIKINFISNKINKNLLLSNLLEQRLDSILYRSYFVINFKEAKNIIKNGGTFVNNCKVINTSYIVKKGYSISFLKKFYPIITRNIKKSLKFEFIPKNLQINYKILKIVYIKLNYMSNYLICLKNRNNAILKYHTNLLFRHTLI